MYETTNAGPALKRQLNRFLRDESGAVTVDWVILTSAIVGMCVAVLAQYTTTIDGATTGMMTDLGTTMTAAANLN